MAEGGIYPWKLQKIRQPKEGLVGTCTYKDITKSLPDPPKGQTWVQDGSSREWRLVPVATATADDTVAVARPESAAAGDVADGTVCTAVPVSVVDASSTAETGVRYHDVSPTDTIIIPANDRNQCLDESKSSTNEQKIAALIQKVAGITKKRLSHSEARAYLDLADWDVDCAVENVREDFGWSAAKKGNAIRKMGSLEVE
ncbi:hypothetical protein ACHAXT_012074 [Thalassiosira profunda]